MALAMQMAINASQAPRRTSNLACCDCLKQKSSISLGAVKAAVALIKDRQVVATNAHFGFVTILVPPIQISNGSHTLPSRWVKRDTQHAPYSESLRTNGPHPSIRNWKRHIHLIRSTTSPLPRVCVSSSVAR